jgi:hypothetical protein
MTSRQEEQAERKRLVGSTNATTYRDLANLDTSLGGRFSEGGTVTGTQPETHYPRLPEGSWSHDPTGVEPPLGYAIDALEPTGNPHEIDVAASLAQSVGGEDAAGALASVPSGPGLQHSEGSLQQDEGERKR